MRIYNAKKGQLTLPLTSGNDLVIASFAPSMEFVPNKPFLESIVRNFDYSELAIIISGPYELSLCSEVSCLAGFLVNSLDQAVAKFAPKEPEEVKVVTKEEPEPVVSEPEEVAVVATKIGELNLSEEQIFEEVGEIKLDIEMPEDLKEITSPITEEEQPKKKNKKNKN